MKISTCSSDLAEIAIDGIAVSAPGSTHAANQDVSPTITVPIAEAALVDFMDLFGSGNLRTQVTMRKIEL